MNCFYLQDNSNFPVKAAGCLFYKNSKNCINVLIQEANSKYEDIGGKIDKTDRNIYDTVTREVEEETNGVIDREHLADRLKKAQFVYSETAKYVVFLVEATKVEEKYTTKTFGDVELYSNIKRTIGWIQLTDLLTPATTRHKLHWRLRNKMLYKKLREVNNLQNNKIKMFQTPKTWSEFRQIKLCQI